MCWSCSCRLAHCFNSFVFIILSPLSIYNQRSRLNHIAWWMSVSVHEYHVGDRWVALTKTGTTPPGVTSYGWCPRMRSRALIVPEWEETEISKGCPQSQVENWKRIQSLTRPVRGHHLIQRSSSTNILLFHCLTVIGSPERIILYKSIFKDDWWELLLDDALWVPQIAGMLSTCFVEILVSMISPLRNWKK